MNNSIIMVPYANLENMKGGVNVDNNNRLNIYMKNCCVSLLSAKNYNLNSDIALVTNIEVPAKYEKILTDNNILIIKAEFTYFKFP